MLKHLPDTFIANIALLVNTSLATSSIPATWKCATVIMLPKTKKNLHDPSNYRPISLLCCLGKLCERVVQCRIYMHLETNNSFIPHQSGFRRFRRTTDNILFITQKIEENFNKGKKVCCIFFDVRKAFDHVWHAGLLWKLSRTGLPHYLLLWVQHSSATAVST